MMAMTALHLIAGLHWRAALVFGVPVLFTGGPSLEKRRFLQKCVSE